DAERHGDGRRHDEVACLPGHLALRLLRFACDLCVCHGTLPTLQPCWIYPAMARPTWWGSRGLWRRRAVGSVELGRTSTRDTRQRASVAAVGNEVWTSGGGVRRGHYRQ